MRVRSLGLVLPVLAVAGCSSGSEPSGAAFHFQAIQLPAGQSLPGQLFEQVSLRVRNRDGDPQRGVTVSFTGDGTVEPADPVTDDRGIATVRWTLPRIPNFDFYYTGGLPGDYQLTARYGDAELTMGTSAHALTLDQVDAGSIYACGTIGARLSCWGYGLDRVAPVPDGWHQRDLVEFPATVEAIELSAVIDALCVVGTSGVPLCTGFSNDQQWVPVTGAPPLTHLTGGGITFCGRAADLTAWCWDDAYTPAFHATQVSPTLHFTRIEAGGGFIGVAFTYACGIEEDGSTWCWGNDNRKGQLGDGTLTPSETPVRVSGNHHFKQVELSFAAACGVEQDDTVWCWGEPGLLTQQSSVPLQVTIPGVMGPLFDVGWQEGYVTTPAGIASWSFGELRQLPQLDALDATTISADNGTLCMLSRTKEAFCSWTLVYGAEETSTLPALVVGVPRPGVPVPPLVFSREASSRQSATAAPPTSSTAGQRPVTH